MEFIRVTIHPHTLLTPSRQSVGGQPVDPAFRTLGELRWDCTHSAVAHRCGTSPSDKLHAEVLGPGLDAINGLWMHTVADEELVLGLTGAPKNRSRFIIPGKNRYEGKRTRKLNLMASPPTKLLSVAHFGNSSS